MANYLTVYRKAKAKFPDAVVILRIGDFAEFFYDDAKTAAAVLGLTLTTRTIESETIPLAGIPWLSLDGYLIKFLKSGFRVAVMEQVESADTDSKIKRDIVRITESGITKIN
jgi:DNA mismatch repair protein MutS